MSATDLAPAAPASASTAAGSFGSAEIAITEHGLAEAIEQFGTDWHGLLEAGGLNISMAPEFLAAGVRSVGREAQVRVLAGRRGGRLVGALPIIRETLPMWSVPMSTVTVAGNIVSYHHEVVAPGCEYELLSACLRTVTRGWDVLRMENVDKAGPTGAALRRLAGDVGSALVSYPGDVAPYLPNPGTWDDYLAARSSNFRYNLKRKEKALKKGGEVQERWFHTVDDVPELYRCMQVVEAKSWKSAANVAVTSKPNEAAYYAELLPFLARQGCLWANALYLGEQPIAYHLCYSHQGRVGNLKNSFDETYQALSPGAVIIQRAIERSFRSGATEFDFLGDDQYHKRLWTDETRAHESHFLFSRSLRGRLIGAAKAYRQQRRTQAFHAVIRRGDVMNGEPRE